MANWEKVLTGVSGKSVETIVVSKRYSAISQSVWNTGYTSNTTGNTRVYGLATTTTIGDSQLYSDTTVYGWPTYRSPVYVAMSDCKVTGFGGFAEQSNASEGLRIGLWKVRPAAQANGASDNLVAAYIGFFDYDTSQNSNDTNQLHAYRDGTFKSATAGNMEKGDFLIVCSTTIPGHLGTDDTYWYNTTSIRVEHD